MNTSVRQIYEELRRRSIAVDTFALAGNRTLLVFEYAGALRSINGTAPDLTSSTGRTIANNKEASGKIADRLGIPIPDTEVYKNLGAARRFLAKHGQIVVKPLDAAHGNGITTDITRASQLKDALRRAKQESSVVLLQQQVSGVDIRVLVVGGQVAAVAQRVHASVVGDGKHSISWLIRHENKTNALRGRDYEKPMNLIDVAAARSFLGKAIKSRPAAGEIVQVVGTANIGTGGVSIERRADMPEELLQQAERFCQAIGTFTCGVDFMYDHDRKEWFFIEANSSPSFGLHVWPAVGEGVDVSKIFVDRLLESYDALAGLPQSNEVIGSNTSVDIIGQAKSVPAKVDTGADSSAIWASNVMMTKQGVLQFVLFDESSPFYTGKVIERKSYKAVVVRSSNGEHEVRYKVQLNVRIGKKRVKSMFTLADRSRNVFPILIGRKTLRDNFLVDVSRSVHDQTIRRKHGFADMLTEDPYTFHTTHYKNKKKARARVKGE